MTYYPANLLNLFIRTAAITSISAFLICEIYDLDVWWHIVIGSDIINNLSVPTKDHFAAASLGRHYHDSHWLFQVLLASSHKAAGMIGVELTMIGLWTITLFYIYRSTSRWVSSSVNYVLLFIAAMASSERFLPRPEIITYLMTAVFYYYLQEGKYKTRQEIAFLFILQVLWTNCHGLFVLGPFMASCYWITEAVRRLRGVDSDFMQTSILLTVILFATLFTPYGIENWRYALLLYTEAGAGGPRLLKTVAELSPTFGEASRSAPAFWFYTALLFSAGLTTATLLYRRQLSPRMIIAAGLFFASLSGRRNMALFAVAASPLLAENLKYLISERVQVPRPAVIVITLAVLWWGWYAVSGNYYLMMKIPARFGFGATPSFFPHALPDFLEKVGFKGQILNSNSFGGFYLYQGYPDRIPLTDGRWEVYDKQIFNLIYRAYVNGNGWEKLISLYKIEGILLQHGGNDTKILVPKLRKDPDWRLVYYDYAASFWMRTDLPQIPPAVNLSPYAPLPPNPKRIEDCLILYLFLRFMDSPDLEIRNLQQALVFGQQTRMLLEKIGTLQVNTGKLREAEKTYQELLSKYPDDVTAINQLAFVAFSLGELKKAESVLSRGLKIYPNNKELRANYTGVAEAIRRSAGQ